MANRLGGVETFRTYVYTVLNPVTAKHAERVVQGRQALGGLGVTAVGQEAIGLQQRSGTEELVRVPPEGRAAGRAARAQNALVQTIQLLARQQEGSAAWSAYQLLMEGLPGVANAMAIFLFYQFFSRLPRDLIEAARVDGFSFFQIYRHIALPLSKPVVSAIAVLQFLEIWNAYLWPVMVTRGPEFRPLSVAMSAYFGTNQAAWGNIMAFAVSMAIPVILFFLLMQRQFIASVVSSGVKG